MGLGGRVGSSSQSWNAKDYGTLPPALPSHSPPKSFHPLFLRNSPLMGTTSPPADIVTGEHLAGAHKQIELEISPGPLISEDLGSRREGRGGQIWPGGQPGPEMVNIQ